MRLKTDSCRAQPGTAVKVAAAVVLLGLLAAAGERSIAPLLPDRPDDRSPADVRATDAVYRHAASYAELDPRDGPPDGP